MSTRTLRGTACVLLLLTAFAAARAQQSCQPRMEQDPSRNNLVHPAGYEPAEPVSLGAVIRGGHGPTPVVLVPGAGFGGEVFAGFIEANADRYSMLAVTLPGFGGTAAPPMPADGTSYAEQTWTRSARDALAHLIEQERLDRPIVVGHWISGTQVALGVALDRPDLVRGVVVVSGVTKFVSTGASMPEPRTPELRAALVDQSLAPQWFKTVTRATWDDNNFLPRDYAIHPLRGLQLWRLAFEPDLQVWIRYLCEVWAADSTRDLDRLRVPLLVLQPELDELYGQGPGAGAYLQAFLGRAWEDVDDRDGLIQIRSVPASRVFVMDDQPELMNEAIRRFADGPASRSRPAARPAPTEPVPVGRPMWNGRLERRGERFVVADGALSIERPDSSWEVEAVDGEPPLVARISGRGSGKVSIQIQPVFGMALDAVVARIESAMATRFAEFRSLGSRPTTVDGRSAIRLECHYEKEGRPERATLEFTKLDDDWLVSVAYVASPSEFDGLAAQFERIRGSLDLE
ncbi:MAG TPA: alpha/beta fold hydrolase [Candidatus Polarisedimenticolaceae bacterium]|nr:alpha/beta fold hydrolase [Candidatus Polarisedimenticolaceae bacterium]